MLKVCDINATELPVSWAVAKVPNGGASFTGYILEFKEVTNLLWVCAIKELHDSAILHVTDLREKKRRKEYQFHVTPESKAGVEPGSKLPHICLSKSPFGE